MGRYTGAKDRLSRREGVDLFGKGIKLTRLGVPPGMHGAKMRRQPSQFGLQLREKQKTKRIYGLYERQFKNYVLEALKAKGDTGESLLVLLERRLDNTVYRLGFAPTRSAARQQVSHRHVLVNGRVVSIASYQVKIGDQITLSAKGLEVPDTKKLLSQKDVKIPSWLEKKAAVGMVKSLPIAAEVTEPISARDIVEYYSR